MAVTYFWNVELSEALYPCLSVLEVTLRNSIHNALTFREGTADWFRHVLEPGQLRDYGNAFMTLYRRHQSNPTTGQIVAELNFGFWTTLLSQPYHQNIWTTNRAALIRSVFPQLPPTPNSRRYLHDRYNRLRELRNRVMHHEPVWQGLTWYRNHYTLNALHAEIVEAVRWMSTTAHDSLLLIDRFDNVYQNRRGQIEADLKTLLGVV